MPSATGLLYPREGNAWWPLPPDYADLTCEGQKLARVNACRLQQDPKLAVHAWAFFCRYYLAPSIDDDGRVFDPHFYADYVPPSVLHIQMVRWFEEHLRVVLAFPRGGAKSITAYSYLLWKLVTLEHWLAAAYVSKHNPFVVRLGSLIRGQLERNERLITDFGNLVPKRGTAPWSVDHLELTTASTLLTFSIEGGLRGPHVHFVLVDDIEQDPKGERIPNPEDIEALKIKATKVIIPILKVDSHLAILCTLFHERSFANSVAKTIPKDSPDFDPRFASVEQGGIWHKAVFGWCDSKGRSLWPEVFTREFIAQRRAELGPAAFASEYENKPISGKDCVFRIDPVHHEYRISDIDSLTYTEPFASTSHVDWHECEGHAPIKTTSRQTLWRDLIGHMLRGITVDPTRSASATSDYAAIVVGGMDERGDLWLLDLWVGKVGQTELCQVLWEYVIRWRPQFVGAEAAGFTEEFYQQADHMRERVMASVGYVPQCAPLKVPTNMSKGQRIQRLQWRYEWGRIKYPGHLALIQPWTMLYDQTLRFTPDLANLPHDDAIDAVEMLQQLFKGNRPGVVTQPRPETPADLYCQGQRLHEGTNIPVLKTSDLNGMDVETYRRVMAEARRTHRPGGFEGDEWGEGEPVGNLEALPVEECW